jgi:hypothetical protein
MQRAGFPMGPLWSIHPCPYGEPAHRALASGRLEAHISPLRPFLQESGRQDSV